jgi:hypothetical protein
LKICIHQPAYLPWLGYLSRIAESDVFVFLDNVQFEKNSFINRNRIKTANGTLWLTIPVLQQGHITKKLIDIEIDSKQDWRKKHLKSIELSYCKLARFESCFIELQALLGKPQSRLADLCYEQLIFWLEKFKITTPVIRSSALPVEGRKSDLVLDLCLHLKATEYLSGPMGRAYLEEDAFKRAGINISYQDYVHPVYPQLYGDFEPGMAAIDPWINCADASLLIQRK